MATYANVSTNPFIRPSNGNNNNNNNNNGEATRSGGAEKEAAEEEVEAAGAAASKKNAPGMARLQSKKERKRAKRREQHTNLLATGTKPDESRNPGGGGGGDGDDDDDDEGSAATNDANDRGANFKEVDLNDNDLLDGCCDYRARVACELDGGPNKVEQICSGSPSAREDLVLEVAALSLVDQVIDLTEDPAELELDGKGLTRAEGAATVNNQSGTTSGEGRQSDDNLVGMEPEEDGTCKAGDEERAPMERDSRRHQHMELIKKLRLQLRDLERYAYERGELEQVPPSVLAERQTVILDSLKRRLPLNIDRDRIERLELEELKSQVDREISELIDPLITKDHLLNQLKTQLTDLERYIAHLHATLGKGIDKRAAAADCSCQVHGCSTPSHLEPTPPPLTTFQSLSDDNFKPPQATLMNNDTLPMTSRLIRGLMAQLICSDIKIQEAMRMEKDFSRYPGNAVPCNAQRRGSSQSSSSGTSNSNHGGSTQRLTHSAAGVLVQPAQFHDAPVWNMHIDRVILATDSLTNLFGAVSGRHSATWQADDSLVDSVVRRQLVPALRDLLAYGLIDPNSAPRARSFLLDPYYIIASLTCLPGSQAYSQQASETAGVSLVEKSHVWSVVEDYFNAHNEPEFRSSSVKTLSQSFNLTPSMDGVLKVTSKQGLLIAVDDIVERLARCKPNGPESHFKLFVYTALNQAKLATWTRIVFRNKSVLRKFYHNFSFVNQADKMDKLLRVIDALSQIEFKLKTDTTSTGDQFVSAF